MRPPIVGAFNSNCSPLVPSSTSTAQSPATQTKVLIEPSMRVRAADLPARNVEHQKIASRHERESVADFTEGQVAAKVGDTRALVERDTPNAAGHDAVHTSAVALRLDFGGRRR